MQEPIGPCLVHRLNEEDMALLFLHLLFVFVFPCFFFFFFSEFLAENDAYVLEVYDVTPEVNLTTSQPLGPRLMYRLNDENATYDPKTGLVPPATEDVLQAWRYKAVTPMLLTDPHRQYQVWCR